MGYNLLGVIEDAVKIPEACTLSLLRRIELDLNGHWDSCIQALSSLGLGKANVVKKTLNTCNLTLMTVQSFADFDIKRALYRGSTTDMGIESKIHDMPVDVIPELRSKYDKRDPLAYMYPNMLGVIDMLHILWGAFETACKENALFKDFLDNLTALVAFASDTQIMRKM